MIVGGFNLFTGILEIAFPLLIYFFMVSKFVALYKEANLEANVFFTYIILGLMIVIGIGNLLLVTKLFSKEMTVKEKYFKYAVILAVGSVLCFWLLTVFLLMSIIMPIYSLTYAIAGS